MQPTLSERVFKFRTMGLGGYRLACFDGLGRPSYGESPRFSACEVRHSERWWAGSLPHNLMKIRGCFTESSLERMYVSDHTSS
jgi:hypothetical protein